MSVSQSRLRYSALGSLGMLVVIAFFAFGLPAVDAALPAHRLTVDGQRYPIGGGISLVPPAGARVDLTLTRPGSDRGTALFLLGDIRYVVVVQPFAGTLSGAADRLATKINSRAGYQLDDERRSVTIGQLPGIAGAYSAAGRPGMYAVLLTDEQLVEITVAGPADQMRDRRDDIERSMETVLSGATR